jgi:hypothetical protein
MGSLSKKLKVLLIVFVILISGCVANSSYDCYDSVRSVFPDSKIRPLNNSTFRFLVLTPDHSVWYVETNSFIGPSISHKEKVF